MAGVGIQHRADPLSRLVDVPIGRVVLATLEHEVLEEMSHPVLLGTLCPGARVERHQERDRARARHWDPVDRQAVVERSEAYLRHAVNKGSGATAASPVAGALRDDIPPPRSLVWPAPRWLSPDPIN